MQEKKPQCLTCRHNLRNTSCSPCTDQGSKLIENLTSNLDRELLSTEEENMNFLKYSCKILTKYPEDFNVVNIHFNFDFNKKLIIKTVSLIVLEILVFFFLLVKMGH